MVEPSQKCGTCGLTLKTVGTARRPTPKWSRVRAPRGRVPSIALVRGHPGASARPPVGLRFQASERSSSARRQAMAARIAPTTTAKCSRLCVVLPTVRWTVLVGGQRGVYARHRAGGRRTASGTERSWCLRTPYTCLLYTSPSPRDRG